MARYTASFPRTTSNSAVQDDGDCCKKRQGKKGSADIRSMTYCGERILVQVHVYWFLKHLQASIETIKHRKLIHYFLSPRTTTDSAVQDDGDCYKK